MNCSPFDLRDYFLKELPDSERQQVETHVRGCAGCREELERLGATEAALFTLREEEIPQRIAFVSDKVFEPSPWRRWWSALWGSAARLGFASAAMLSVAILVSALTRPAPAPAHLAGISAGEVDQRIQAAVAASEARQTEKVQVLVKDLERRTDQEHNLRMIAEESSERLQMRNQTLAMSMSPYGPPHEGLGGPK
jgi:anti-sigma factor RsiW